MPMSRRNARVILAIILVAAVAWVGWGGRDPRIRPRNNGPAQSNTAAGISVGDNAINPAHADFRGEWKLDLKASDSIEPILKAQGRNALERAIARSVAVTHVITQNDDEIGIEIKAGFFSQTERAVPDGKPRKSVDEADNEIEVVDRWSDDGQTLITEGSALLADGKAARATFSRSLADEGRSMYLVIEYKLPDGSDMRIRRVFRRVE